MRRVVIFAVIMALVVASVGGAALAKGQGHGKGQGQESGKGHGKGKGQGRGKGSDKLATFNFKGTVVAVGQDSLVLDVEKGNKKARPFVGQQMTFAVNEATKVERDDVPVSVTELSSGEDVHVQSKAARDATEFTARVVSAETKVDEPETTEPVEDEIEAPDTGEDNSSSGESAGL